MGKKVRILKLLEGWEDRRVCPVCGKRISRLTTPLNAFRGLLAMHIKHRHEEYWRGDLTLTLSRIHEGPANTYGPY